MTEPRPPRRRVPRNVWAASATSFFTDLSSEMVLNVVPLFLANVLGARTAVIGLIEGVAGSTASFLQVVSGSLSDRLGRRKGLAVAGYALSACAKPLFAVATSWGAVAAARWGDRVGKGIRTAPRDALVADSIAPDQRGLAFGLHRAADTGGAVVGIGIALAVVWGLQGGGLTLDADTFRTLVLVSLVPAFLAVAILAFGAREVPRPAEATAGPARPRLGVRGLGRRFGLFLGVSALFDLGNFSDAFLVLRAQDAGLGVHQVLLVLLGWNLAYALLSTPAGSLSDRVGRRRVLVCGWLLYALVYLGFARVEGGLGVAALFLAYGAYYGLTAGTAKAYIADLVPAPLRGTAYGTYHAVLGLIDLPASLIAGLLWQGVGAWEGFGAAAPFTFGAACAGAAALGLWVLLHEPAPPGSAQDEDEEDDEPNLEDPVVLPIERAIDLHAFHPREIPEVVDAYLDAARERGFTQVRLIHGRGKGVQRARLRRLLEGDPRVERLADAPPERGGWGAMDVWLRGGDGP